MKVVRILLIAIMLTAAWGTPAAQADDAAKRTEVIRLLELTKAGELINQMTTIIIPQFTGLARKFNPNIPEKVEKELTDIIVKTLQENSHVYIDSMVEIYSRVFTVDEIRQIIAFYETPVGQKTIVLMPRLMREGIVAGQRWGQSVAPLIEQRVRRKLHQRGYKWAT